MQYYIVNSIINTDVSQASIPQPMKQTWPYDVVVELMAIKGEHLPYVTLGKATVMPDVRVRFIGEFDIKLCYLLCLQETRVVITNVFYSYLFEVCSILGKGLTFCQRHDLVHILGAADWAGWRWAFLPFTKFESLEVESAVVHEVTGRVSVVGLRHPVGVVGRIGAVAAEIRGVWVDGCKIWKDALIRIIQSGRSACARPSCRGAAGRCRTSSCGSCSRATSTSSCTSSTSRPSLCTSPRPWSAWTRWSSWCRSPMIRSISKLRSILQKISVDLVI